MELLMATINLYSNSSIAIEVINSQVRTFTRMRLVQGLQNINQLLGN